MYYTQRTQCERGWARNTLKWSEWIWSNAETGENEWNDVQRRHCTSLKWKLKLPSGCLVVIEMVCSKQHPGTRLCRTENVHRKKYEYEYIGGYCVLWAGYNKSAATTKQKRNECFFYSIFFVLLSSSFVISFIFGYKIRTIHTAHA